MKKGLCLIALLLMASFASALTITWTNVTVTGPDGGPGHCGLILVADKPDSWGKILPYFATYESSNYTPNGTALEYVKVDGSKYYADLGTNGSVNLDTITTEIPKGTDSVTFVLFNLYYSGYMATHPDDQTYFSTLTITGLESLTGDTTIDLSNYTIEWTKDLYLDQTMSVAPSVPEPTVLALLALGVAGLALKRRVK